MIYIDKYHSIIGDILIASKNNKLIGLWFINDKCYLSKLKEEIVENNNDLTIKKVKKWLDKYFNKKNPNIKEIKLKLIGTPFQKEVWQLLLKIPYGTTTTYQEIAQKIAQKRKIKRMSNQAVGNAISHNPISIIIPCHRVIGKNGQLIGYAGGLDKKEYLLKLEQK